MSHDPDISPIYGTSSIAEPSLGNFRFSSPQTLPQRTTATTLLPSDDEDEEDLSHVSLAEHLKQLSVEAVEDRFFGPSRYVLSPDINWRIYVRSLPAFLCLPKTRRI
jgi:hypothetical protein